MKVDVGFLHRADSITPQFRRSLTMLLMRDARTKQQIAGEWDQESSANISAGRCNIVRNFLAGQSEWLWMLDSDMTFGVDILERLLRSADAQAKPIMGGLCFGLEPERINGVDQFNAELGSRYRAFPTIYTVNEGGFSHCQTYPSNTVVRCDSTGAACVLIHRRVLADPRWHQPKPHPFPWFREAVFGDKPMSEDHFFFAKARQMGYPLHVDTGAKTGHVKPLVVDELFFDEHR